MELGEDFTPNTSFWGRIMEFFRNLFEKFRNFSAVSSDEEEIREEKYELGTVDRV